MRSHTNTTLGAILTEILSNRGFAGGCPSRDTLSS